jgi:hypothetical protein
MARPAKVKVDYFPHVTHTGKSIAILETRWGNDGYAFWFKLLELLGDSDDFAYNCNQSADWEYLLSKTRVTDPVALAILNKLAEIGAIDAECWTRKIVWSDHFVRNLESVFEKRKRQAPQKPEFTEQKPLAEEVSGEHHDGNSPEQDIIPTETDKLNESKPNESKAEESKPKQNESEEIEKEKNEPEETRAGAGEIISPTVPVETTETKKNSRTIPEPVCPSQLREGVEQQADTVFLKQEELERLRSEYGDEAAERIIVLLDAYKTNHPKKCSEYRDDYKVITSWVIQRYREERASPKAAGQDHTFMGILEDMALEEEL